MDTLRSLRHAALAVLDHLAFAPPLLARLIIGLVFVPSGWGKLHDLEQITAFFESLGIPFAAIQAPFVATVELVCGALVLIGLGTRLAAVPLIGTMLVATLTAVWPNVEGVLELATKIEPMLIGLLAYVVVQGPGPLSLDRLLVRAIEPGVLAPVHTGPARG